MWQLYAFGAIVLNCLENITDKRAMRGQTEIASDVATFVRVLLYSMLVVPITILFGQSITWYCTPGIILFGIASTFVSSAYTSVLKKVDITTLSVLTYLASLIYLFIDNAIGHDFKPSQIMAITGLVFGGIGFSLDRKLILAPSTIGLLVFMLGYSGAEFYYIQHLFKTEGLSGISFFANVWGWATVFLAANLVFRRRLPLLLTRDALTYARFSVLAKGFDVGNSLASGMALTMSTVSQYSSMQVFFPPTMLLIALFVQKVWQVDLGEQIDRNTIKRKICMSFVLVVSGFFL